MRRGWRQQWVGLLAKIYGPLLTRLTTGVGRLHSVLSQAQFLAHVLRQRRQEDPVRGSHRLRRGAAKVGPLEDAIPLDSYKKGQCHLFVDLLGFSDLSLTASNELLAVNRVLEFIRVFGSAFRRHKLEGMSLYQASDSIIITSEWAARGGIALGRIAEEGFLRAHESEILVRGAIAWGPLYDVTRAARENAGDDEVHTAVVGRGLTKAANLERMLDGARIAVDEACGRGVFEDGLAITAHEPKEHLQGDYRCRVEFELAWWRSRKEEIIRDLERRLLGARQQMGRASQQVSGGYAHQQVLERMLNSHTTLIDVIESTLAAVRSG